MAALTAAAGGRPGTSSRQHLKRARVPPARAGPGSGLGVEVLMDLIDSDHRDDDSVNNSGFRSRRA
jgi:hypothetical protein